MIMSKKTSQLLLVVLTILIVSNFPTIVFAETQPIINARTAILYDVNTKKTLYGKDEHKRMYPASMTKILTALVFLEYFKEDEFVVVGNEIENIPGDSSKAGNIEGETLRVDNLIRLVIIPSGNETCCVAALAAAKRALNNETVTYVNAEKWFCETMNEKAKQLGAVNTHFVNPHGYHDPDHYSTAYDMAIIADAAMENDLIRKIVAETVFKGNGAGDNPDPTWITKDYNLKSHNELINGSEFSYGYATGIKTGRMDESGDCVAASATKDDRSLISVIMFSQDPGRWDDAAALFEYGFNNYAIEDIQTEGMVTGEIALSEAQLGAEETIAYETKGTKSDLLTKEQAARIVQEISFNKELLAESVVDPETGKKDDTTRLKLPIEEGTVIGTVNYSLDGESIFTDNIIVLSSADVRSFNSDVDYYVNIAKKKATSPMAIPVYTAIVVVIGLIIKLISTIKKRRNRNSYRIRGRF